MDQVQTTQDSNQVPGNGGPAVSDPGTDSYRVKLEVFSGPLDLLLYLIKQEEVDIYDIPIARITQQYLRYIEMMKTLDLEVAGEFILMAATLIRIKTRLLLPVDDTDSDEPDPREELIMALVEYKKYKEAGEVLRSRAEHEERLFIPPAPVEKIEGRVDLEPATSLYDLIVAFKDVVSSSPREVVHEVNPEEVSIEERMEVVLGLLQAREFATFRELFADLPRRTVAIVTFVALLELARQRRV
ncbi:segregation/condensation protein A, partial [candidate division GN15 bacterium]|nr:segregation/condensation protein A [candidate division GN15 bacterium]